MIREQFSEEHEPSQAELDARAVMCALWREGEVRELRAFSVPDRKGSDFRHGIMAGYFDSPERAAAEAVRLSELGAEAVYWTPNPVNPELLARAVNRVKKTKKGVATGDADIVRRVVFLLDADPIRPADISATDDEHEAARRRMGQIVRALEADGWPRPIVVDSGNGWHGYWATDLPNDAASLDLVKGALAGLGARYSDEAVKVDAAVCNASRIFRVPGTWARKGDSTERRPHRLSRLASLPDGWGEQVVSAEQLAALAPAAPEPARAAATRSSSQAARAPQAQADDVEEVRGWIDEALGAIDPGCPYNDWVSVGTALKDVFGSAEGFALWDRWSSGSAKYPGADKLADKWEQLAASRHPGEEARTIIGLAKGFDLGAWRRRQRAAQRAAQTAQPAPRVAVISESCAADVVDVAPGPDGVLEVLPPEIVISDGYMTWRFGAGRCEQRTPRGDDEERREPFASDVWPRYHYASEDGHEHGVLYQYRAVRGALCWSKMDASCFVANAPGTRAAQDAARAGVRVHPGSDGLLALALGHWAARREGEHITLVDRPGWHRHRSQWIYLQGQRVIGDAPWMADPTAPGLLYRDARASTVEAWRTGMDQLIVTNALRAVVATALAGALLTRLGRQTFIVNLYGDSTAGKSTSLWLAAAAWGNPSQLVRSWDATLNAMEGLALSASDACLCLDELQRFVEAGREEELSRAIHALAGATGRARLSRDAKLRDVASWKMCVLSSSESAIRDLVGKRYRGGDSVRALDVPVSMGELTTSAAHAEQVESWARRCYGHAGEALARHLITLTDLQVHEVWQRWQVWLRGCFTEPSAEGGRVLDNLAVLGAALELGAAAGVHGWSQQACADAVWWAAQPIMRLREGVDNPRERQMSALIESLVATPACWPTERGLRDAREVWGVLRPIGERLKQGERPKEEEQQAEERAQIDYDRYELWTQEGLLRRGPLKGHDVRSFLAWMNERGLAEYVGNTRIRGIQGKWWKLHLEAIGEALEQPQEATLPQAAQGS